METCRIKKHLYFVKLTMRMVSSGLLKWRPVGQIQPPRSFLFGPLLTSLHIERHRAMVFTGGGALTLERGMGMCRGQSPLPSPPIYCQCTALVPLFPIFFKIFAFSTMFWPKFQLSRPKFFKIFIPKTPIF